MLDNKIRPKLNNERTFGVVENFDFRADTRLSILAACQIMQSYHKRITHYITRTEEDGTTTLILCWGSSRRQPKEIPLPIPFETPEETSDFIAKWLERSAVYPKDIPDTDGSVEAGFRICQRVSSDFHLPVETDYDVMVVSPAYIVYRK